MVNIKRGSYPRMRFDAETFKSKINDEDLYFGVPKDFFNIVDDSVYVSTDIVPLIAWDIIDKNSNPVIIRAKEQRIQIMNNEYYINNSKHFEAEIKEENIKF